MPSPFPGMNPYFEQAAHWQDFHTESLSALRRLLAPGIAPRYIVQLEEHVSIHDLPPGPRRPVGRADLAVTRLGTEPAGRPALGVLEAPAEVRLPVQDIERIPFLEVRDRKGRELVTVIELLSPSHKRPGEDREPISGQAPRAISGQAPRAAPRPGPPGRDRSALRLGPDAGGGPAGGR